MFIESIAFCAYEFEAQANPIDKKSNRLVNFMILVILDCNIKALIFPLYWK